MTAAVRRFVRFKTRADRRLGIAICLCLVMISARVFAALL